MSLLITEVILVMLRDHQSPKFLLQDVNGDVFIGKVWPGYTAYPDFLNPKTVQYWQNEVIPHRILSKIM